MQQAEETLDKAARGDHSAFAEIVRCHQAMVFGLARHFLRDRGLAEELAQEVFLELHRSLRSIESPAHLTFWLRRVTSNRCIDSARRRRLRPETSLDELPELAEDAAPRDPILTGKLQRCVAALPETPRMILILRYQEDLTPAE